MLVNVNGVSLFYEKRGKGKPIVLLHGNGEDHRIFDVLTRSLEKEYTVYALDSRGHGQSGGEEISYDLMAEDTAAFLRLLKIEKPILYGFSDGGIVGLILALRYPGLLSKLAVSGANVTPEGLRPMYRFFFRVGYFFTRRERVNMMLTQPQITAAQLGRITVPTLVMAGEKDLIRREHTEEIAAAIKGSELCILSGELHGSYVVHSRKLYPILKPFLEK